MNDIADTKTQRDLSFYCLIKENIINMPSTYIRLNKQSFQKLWILDVRSDGMIWIGSRKTIHQWVKITLLVFDRFPPSQLDLASLCKMWSAVSPVQQWKSAARDIEVKAREVQHVKPLYFIYVPRQSARSQWWTEDWRLSCAPLTASLPDVTALCSQKILLRNFNIVMTGWE